MSWFKSNRMLALDIGASELKLGEFRAGRAGLELLCLAERSLGLEPERESDASLAILEAFQALLRENELAPAPVSISVAAHAAFLRLVKLPPVKPARIFQTVQYEAQQNVPFPIDEVVWDYQLMGDSTQELDVLLAAIKTDIVQNLADCIEAAGLTVQLVDVCPLALYNAVRYNYPDLDGCTLVIDIGAHSSDLVLIEEGRLSVRPLPVIGAGNTITQQVMKEFKLPFGEAEALKRQHACVAFGGAYEDFSDQTVSRVSKTVRNVLSRLHVEVERHINFSRTQHGFEPPRRVLLAGGASLVARTDEFFREKLRLEVGYLNPFANVLVADTIAADQVAACAHRMGAVVGMGLRHALPCPVEINLLPPRLAAEKAFRKKQPFLIAAAASLVLVALCWCFYYSIMAPRKAERRARVQETVRSLAAVESRLQRVEMRQARLRARPAALVKLIDRRSRWLRVLDDIYRSLPDGMWLVSLAPLEQRRSETRRRGAPPAAAPESTSIARLRVEGRVFLDRAEQDGEQAPMVVFRDRLRASPLFTENTEIERQPMPKPEDYARDFSLLIELREPF